MSVSSTQQTDFFDNVFRHVTLSADVVEQISSMLRLRSYPRNSFIVHAGERWEKLYYIESGLIRMFYTDLQGRDFNKAFFSESRCVWPVAPRDREKAVLFSIGTVEPTTTIECPMIALQTTLRACGLWESFALPFAEMLVTQKFQREYDLQLLTATQRFEQLLQTKPDLVRRIPDYHLASFLGITNVSLSRIKRTFLEQDR